jgi:hypothetical protein
MKKLIIFVLLLAVAACAQEAANQRYQLFQGKYTESGETIYMSGMADPKVDSSNSRVDTSLALFKIDTQSGQVWVLKSSRSCVDWKTKLVFNNGFGWDAISVYKEELKTIQLPSR